MATTKWWEKWFVSKPVVNTKAVPKKEQSAGIVSDNNRENRKTLIDNILGKKYTEVSVAQNIPPDPDKWLRQILMSIRTNPTARKEDISVGFGK